MRLRAANSSGTLNITPSGMPGIELVVLLYGKKALSTLSMRMRQTLPSWATFLCISIVKGLRAARDAPDSEIRVKDIAAIPSEPVGNPDWIT